MLKIIKKFSKKEFILLAISIFSMILSVLFDLFQPIVFGWISKTLSENPTWSNQFGIAAGIMSAAAIGGIITNIIAIYLSIKVTVALTKRLRIDMFNKVQYFSSCDLDKISTSSMINRINNDVTKVEQLMFLLFTMFVKAPAYFIGGLTLSIISLFLPLTGATFDGAQNIAYVYIVFPILTIITFLILYKTFPIFDKTKVYQDQNNSIMSENLIGAKVVRAFNLENDQIKRYQNKIVELRKNSIKGEVIVQIFMPLFLLCMNMSIVFIIGYSGFLSSNIDPSGNLKPSDMVPIVTSIIQYFNILTIGFYLVAFVLAMYSTTRASAKRINEIYEMKTTINESANPISIKNNDITFKNVWFKYFEDGEDWALENLSLEIKSGQTIGVIGQTGCGKSTLVNLLTRLYDVSQGQILIGGDDIKEVKINDLRKNIAVSLQEKILLSGSIEDNIRVGKQDATNEEVKNAATMAEAYEFIKEKDGQFKYRIEERGRNLSGGQKQRVSIARALISNPKILIFDDSTSALDNITEKKLLNNIKSGLKGSTLIIIAQRINSIKDADNIFVLNDGKLIGEGNHNYLMKNNKTYQDIYKSQDTSKE